MPYLLDTCVVSEPTRKSPCARVRIFLNSLPPGSSYLSVLTIGEVRKGIESMSESARKQQLLGWLDIDLRQTFRDRILPVDEVVAKTWGRLTARLEATGRVLPTIDALIAATALVHGLQIVTRNVADFDGTGVDIVNPWQ